MFQRSKQGAVDVVYGESPLTRDYLDRLSGLIESCLRQGPPQTVFNLAEVPLIDSAGLEWLLDTQDAFVVRGGVLKLARLNGLCRDILMVTGVGRSFEIFSDVTAAVGSFAQ